MENHLGKYRIASVRHDKSHPTIVTSHAFSHRAMPFSIRDVTSSEGQMTHLKRILYVGSRLEAQAPIFKPMVHHSASLI
ncbi:unnamed protein product [Penicillium roqueforti FM164]|uniref:Genomic scaffold, ProqFM164S01 n=1 Tax=Penicillium roqueforti (strain FM164) TaxID=1365484 RepID=W6PRB0_PENRF|nr:unnamed protein product [Penicillium roqueforti FM164]